MKNHTQIKKNNNGSTAKLQRKLRSGRGPSRLSDAASIFFNEFYHDIREKSFDEAVCLFEAMWGLIKLNPAMKAENRALAMIVQGAASLQGCMPVKRSEELNRIPA